MVVSGGFESLQGFFLFEKILLSSELQPEGFLSCSDIRHLLCIICRAEDPYRSCGSFSGMMSLASLTGTAGLDKQ